MDEEMHRPECAYSGLPRAKRGRLPWPADPDCDDMCICHMLDKREENAG